MRRAALPIALLAAAPLGCSAIVAEIEVSCSDDRDCDALNAKERLGAGSCLVYQCRDRSKGCEKAPRDRDRDGHPDQTSCSDAGLAEPLDCDDDDGARHPDAGEVCDRIDNDCDRKIDEGQLGEDTSPLRSVSVSRIDWLNAGASSSGRLPIVSTTNKGTSASTDLYIFSQDGLSSRPIQQDATSCTTTAELSSGCTLHQASVALTFDAWIAAGVNVLGCARGAVRFASSALDDDALPRWDGDRSTKSNLRTGIPHTPDCPGQGARAPILAVSELPGASAHALALWRAPSPTEEAGVLLGIGLSVKTNPGASPSVRALSDEPPSSLRADSPGLDPASILPWRDGFLVAHDVPDGIELAFVSKLGRGASDAFASAVRLTITSPGARYATLAVSESDRDGQLALAWRAPGTRGWTVHFAQISPASPERLGHGDEVPPIAIPTEGDVMGGPALAHATHGYALDERGNQVGGWFVAWIERRGARQVLKGARVRSEGGELLEEPFILHGAANLEHVFARALRDDVIYGFVSSEGVEQQLNIGSLPCAP